MGAHGHWLREAAWAMAAAAALMLWHGQVHAACVDEVADSLFLEEAGPLPDRSGPGIAARAPPSVAAEKLRAGDGPSSAAAACARSLFAAATTPAAACRPASLPWRSYCERSTRLLN